MKQQKLYWEWSPKLQPVHIMVLLVQDIMGFQFHHFDFMISDMKSNTTSKKIKETSKARKWLRKNESHPQTQPKMKPTESLTTQKPLKIIMP